MLAQTTYSASNNHTMASRMFDILDKNNGTDIFDWRPENMHTCSFCHKIAFIVKAVLAKLGIFSPKLQKVKESILGTFPYPNNMETILEEEDKEEIEDKNNTSPSAYDGDSETEKNEEERIPNFLRTRRRRKRIHI